MISPWRAWVAVRVLRRAPLAGWGRRCTRTTAPSALVATVHLRRRRVWSLPRDADAPEAHQSRPVAIIAWHRLSDEVGAPFEGRARLLD
jgi:hypothetical protein